MSWPRELRLERLNDRGGRGPHLVEVARVASADVGVEQDVQAAREALNNAVFTAPGVWEWLNGLRRAVAAMLGGKDAAPPVTVPADAIRTADPAADLRPTASHDIIQL